MEKINFESLPSTNTPINASNLNQMQTNVENDIGDLADLETEAKNNLVSAINEANQHGSGGGGEVVNDYSESQEKAYSCNYINNNFESKSKLLWTNPNPNNAFPEQDVTLNSDDYDIIGWVIRLGTTNNNTDILFTIKGWGGRYYYGTQQRQFNRTSNTKYHVSGGTSSVSEAVPIYAIGFKFGLNL